MINRRSVALAAAFSLAVGLLPTLVSADESAGPPEERVGPPASIAVIGDSISVGTGSDGPGSPSGAIGSARPAASWATGNHPGLNSLGDRLDALDPDTAIVRYNLADNGANMRNNFVNQIRTVPEGTELVVVQMGGNDLCRPNVGAMTPVELYAAELTEGLEWLAEHRPETLVSLYSVPDIYNLWYIRGAAHQGERFGLFGLGGTAAGPRPARVAGEHNPASLLLGARLLWDTLGVIPCQSLLQDPSQPRNAGPTPDPTHPSEQRRLTVRQRNIDFNTTLSSVCAEYLRCRDDAGATFDFSSNRDANGNLQSDTSQWRFVDADISLQDHFHPSFAGQRKLAEVAFESSFDFTDVTAPEVTISVTPAGWTNADEVAVEIDAVDPAGGERDPGGVRGIEYRVDGGEWTAVLDDRVSLTFSDEGVTLVEARALDVNGNQSAIESATVSIDRTDPVIDVTSPVDGDVFVLGAEVSAEYSCSDDLSGIVSCTDTRVDTSTVGDNSISFDAADAAGNTATTTVTYGVRYVYSGQTGPLFDGLEWRVGSTIPVRFTMSDALGIVRPEAVVEVWIRVGDAEPVPAVQPGRGQPGNVARWDPSDQQFVFNVSTAGLPVGEVVIELRSDDGAVRQYGVNLLP